MTAPRLAALGLLFGVFFGSTEAFAHATLVSASPTPDSEGAAPGIIQLHFSEAYEPAFSTVKLTDTDGSGVALKAVDSKDPTTMAVAPVTPLSPGLYTVTWSTVGHDTHKRTGSFSFTVK